MNRLQRVGVYLPHLHRRQSLYMMDSDLLLDFESKIMHLIRTSTNPDIASYIEGVESCVVTSEIYYFCNKKTMSSYIADEHQWTKRLRLALARVAIEVNSELSIEYWHSSEGYVAMLKHVADNAYMSPNKQVKEITLSAMKSKGYTVVSAEQKNRLENNITTNTTKSEWLWLSSFYKLNLHLGVRSFIERQSLAHTLLGIRNSDEVVR
ncbi:MAG: hypothetical protein HAW67_02365 [Endozoicomonadaceae bacterium]|nr:hypothetical protein [Endozoicomonadaceae bacterium]